MIFQKIRTDIIGPLVHNAVVGGLPIARFGSLSVSKLFPLRKLLGAEPEGSGPAWGRSSEGRNPFLVSRRYGGVGAGALPLVSMISKHDSEANEDEDMNLQKIPVYKKM